MITIRFSGRRPSPEQITMGQETDSGAEKIRFLLPEIGENQVATVQMILPDGKADAVTIEDNMITVPARLAEIAGRSRAWVEILADGVAWHSEIFYLDVGELPPISERTEQEYPTAFQEAIARSEAAKRAAEIAAAIAKSAQGNVTVEINGDGDLIVTYEDTEGETHEANLGPVSAYTVAKKYGFPGTEQEWEEAIASVGEKSDAAAQSAEDAADSAEEAQTAKTAAQAASTAAQTAQAAAETAAARDVTAWLEENITNPDSPPLDRTLSFNTAAAPADMVGDLKSALSANEIATLIDNGWILGKRMGTPDVGETFTDSPGLISSWQYIKLPCNPGDVFTINATGSSTFRTWAFADSSLKCLARNALKNNASVSVNEVIIAPDTAAWLYINQNADHGDCFVGKYIGDRMKATENEIELLSGKINALGSPIDTNQNYAPIIPATIPDTEDEPNDLDLYMTPGTFRVTTSAVAQALLHCPASAGGRLIVMNLSESAAKLQMYLSTNGSIYVRKGTSSSGYSETWSTLATAADVAAVSSALTSGIDALGTPFATRQAYTTVIQTGDDLNDYTTPGNYRVTTNSVAKSVSNIPVSKAGRFTVLNTSENNAKMQVYFANNDGIYFRMYTYAAGYKEWYKLSTNKDIPTDESGNSNASKGAYNLTMAIAKQMTYNLAFANAFTPIPLENYAGNTENVHPKVLYFQNKFGGHYYWMAYTPYPGSNDDYENPCIAYSDDGYAWKNYADNPLDTSENPSNYNSDTHLVYREDTATLECWYRFVDEVSNPKKEIIYRRTTTDGVTWTEREVVTEHEGAVTRYLSPAVIWDNTNKVYHIWAVHGSAYGGSVGITYFTADENDLTEWVEVRDYALSFDDEGMTVNPWHLDVIKDGTTYIMLVMCRNGQTVANNRCSLFVSTSSDNITYSTPEKVVGGADNWDKFMYRSSIVKVGDIYRIYYSAGTGGKTNIYGSGSKWGLGITESSGLNHFYGCFE